MSFPLNNTENPITATERLKINENWQRLSGYLLNLQYQIDFLSGDAEIDLILEDIEEAITAANNAATNANSTIVDMNAALAQVQNALNNANTAVTNATNALDDANEALDTANTAIAGANTATAGANAAKNAANTAANAATTAANAANAATTNANTATTNANAATTAANTAATTANQLIGQMQTLITQGNALVTSLNEFDWKGVYSASVTYRKNNFVQYNRSTYVALKQNLGITPNDNGVDWRLAAGAGVDGQGAVSKVNGIAPDASGNVTLLPNTTQQVNWLTAYSKNNTDLATAYPTGITTLYVRTTDGFPLDGVLTTYRAFTNVPSGDLQVLSSAVASGANVGKVMYRTAGYNTNAWGVWREYESTTGAQAKVDAHANLTNNPHQVTSQQVNQKGMNFKAMSATTIDYPLGITIFNGDGDGGWERYCTVINFRSATYGGGSYQMRIPYGPNYGGEKIEYRYGIYSVLGQTATWSDWSTFETTTGAQAKVDAAVSTKWVVSGTHIDDIKTTGTYRFTTASAAGLNLPVGTYLMSVMFNNGVATQQVTLTNTEFINYVYSRVWNAGILPATNGWSPFKRLDFESTTGNLTSLTTTNKNNLVSAVNETKLTNDNRNTQLQYQTAQPSGTVLRLTKPSDSARIFFRLNTAVTGDIKISLDSGTTTQPLRDFGGTQVNGITPGFYEIVQDSTFFILRNKGGVSQADLDALITAANEVEANSNAIRTDLINTVNAAYPSGALPADATFTQAIGVIPNIGTDKKRYASGDVTSSGSGSYPTYTSGNVSMNNATVPYSAIGFVPSKVMIYRHSSPFGNNTTTYYKDFSSNPDYVSVSIATNGNVNNASAYGIKVNDGGVGYVSELGFRLPVSGNGVSFKWEAYE